MSALGLLSRRLLVLCCVLAVGGYTLNSASAGAAAEPELLHDLGIELVAIPAGSFQMGCSADDTECWEEEKPPHRVQVKAFKMMKYEVTFAQWDACIADGGCRGYRYLEPRGRDDQPVVNVSWDDAQRFIVWLNRRTNGGFRLPTEAEWEYAARGGTETRHYWGGESSREHENYRGTRGSDRWVRTAPVGQLRPNGFGLYDMMGNVSEWTQDCWHTGYQSAPADGSAWGSDWDSGYCWRVLRGGSWGTDPEFLSVSRRGANEPSRSGEGEGFRLVRVPLPVPGQESSGGADVKKQEAELDMRRRAEDPYYDCGTKAGRYRSAGRAVVDCEQRLLWALGDDGSDMNWEQARTYCAALGAGWSLPSRPQLQSISRVRVMEAVAWIQLTGGWYWSVEGDGSAAAWIMPLSRGLWYSVPVSYSYGRAACVHGSG